ncbi:peptidase MA family metallohydrolase [Dehalogenimonas sp. THU2]|uniref:peptidase MA family metallohydrolase n=1 Tax=Dehalogenimonas sp. THU2 TaxID=3151121 RepID=UPI0032186D8F
MIKRLSYLAIVFAMMLGVAAPGSLAAAEGIAISRVVHSTQFPTNISFSLTASSEANIVDARLHYLVEKQGFATVENEVLVRVMPAKEITLSYSLDLRRTGGLPPGTRVDYWWTVRDAEGGESVSQVTTLDLNDARYQWQSIKQGMVTLYWYSGPDSFARDLMSTAQDALVKLENDAGAHLSEPVALYIYDGAQALQGSMVFPQEWTGGVAFTNFNTIAIGIETYNVTWGKRAIVHELAHLVTHQMTANPYNTIPIWLNEGLSMYAEGPLDAIYQVFYNQALDQQALISVRSLSSPFSAYANISYLSYAESYHAVKYLIDKYGQDKLLRLLDTFAGGATADSALMVVYGFDMDGLDEEWQDYAYNATPDRFQGGVIWTPWLAVLIVLVAGASVVTAVWLFFPIAVKKVERN